MNLCRVGAALLGAVAITVVATAATPLTSRSHDHRSTNPALSSAHRHIQHQHAHDGGRRNAKMRLAGRFRYSNQHAEKAILA